MKNTLLTVILFFTTSLFSFLSAQDRHQPVIDQAFGDSGEIYFKFAVTDKSEADLLTRIISIDNVRGGEVFAYANKKEFAAFLDLGLNYTILPHPGKLLDESKLMMPDPNDAPGTVWNFYPTYQQYLDFMAAFAADHPDICRVDTIGYTVQDRLLLAVKISDNVSTEEGEPQFLYTSSIHGDETTGYVLMLHLIDYLLSGYGTDPRITEMIDSTEIYINPLANPDGTYHGGNNSVYGAQRYNANNVDLNRNYPDPADGPHPDGNAWQPETVAFMAFADTNHFVMSANFHGGTSVLNYPWDTWAKLTADDEWWKYVCREYVDTVHLYGPGSYYSGYDNGITNGYAWYRITGGRQDYMNYFQYCREVTNEISDIKLLPANQLLNYWEYNYRSLLNYIEEVNYGAQGTVTDSVTGEPLDAKLYIFGHDMDNSYVYSKLPSGTYSRLLYEGSYNISFSRAGYFSKLVQGVEIVNRQRTQMDVQLVPLNIGVQEDGQHRMAMACPNPANGSFRLVFPTISAGETTVRIFNAMGKIVYRSVFPAGLTTSWLDLGDISSGLYIIRADCREGHFEDRLIISR
jgi:hypothetical protein